MKSVDDRLRKALRPGGAIRTHELERAGIARTQIARMVTAGRVKKLARGLYAAPDYLGTENSALVAVAKRGPSVVFCLLTALRFHEITTQSPFEVWIAIPNKAHPPRIAYPPLRIVRFSEASLHYGVEVRRSRASRSESRVARRPSPTASSSGTQSGLTLRSRRCAM